MIEVDRDVGRYASVCQVIFESGDQIMQYGAGGTDPEGNQQDGILRRAARRIGGMSIADYGLPPRHVSPGDSGGPSFYDGSVMAVNYGWRWKKTLTDLIRGTTTDWDIMTNLADGWVFRQGIAVAKRRCRPDRSLAFAHGRVKGMFNRVTAGSGGQWWRWQPAQWTDTIEFSNEYGQQMGRIYLKGGAKAKGSASAGKGFCKIVASGDRITFYQSDGDHCRATAGTILLQGANLVGTSTAGGSAGGYFGGVTGRLRTIELRGVSRSGRLGSLRFLPL